MGDDQPLLFGTQLAATERILRGGASTGCPLRAFRLDLFHPPGLLAAEFAFPHGFIIQAPGRWHKCGARGAGVTLKSKRNDKAAEMQDASNLIWVDLEMTGLDPDNDVVIEIATIVTDSNLNSLAEGPVIAIHQSDEYLDNMDEWNTTHHTSSGLVDRVRASEYDERRAAAETIAFLEQWVPENSSPMCGNTICQDRRFMARHLPELEAYFHYRNLDVSTLKILMQRWRPELEAGFRKSAVHLALDDIRESIDEMRYYREHFLNLPQDGLD